MKRVILICAIALLLVCAIWIAQTDKKYPLNTVIVSLLEYKDHKNGMYLYGSDSGFSRRPNLIGDFVSHLAPSVWNPAAQYFNQIYFAVGDEMMHVNVFHFNDGVDSVEIHVAKTKAIAGDRMKTKLLDQFPELRCRIVYH